MASVGRLNGKDRLLRYILFSSFLYAFSNALNEREFNIGEISYENETVNLHLVCGDVLPSNWSYFEIKWPGRIRVVLQSLSGDADLYLSYRLKKPGVGVSEHDMVSASCGLDVVDISQYGKRPVHVGVYGHPSKPKTSYKLLLMMIPKHDSEFDREISVPVEIISEYNLPTDAEKPSSSLKDSFFSVVGIVSQVFFEILFDVLL
ncbi:hypothetical protein AB6A40_009034 [Gnathostoma spinigerum]|uniref:Uncharacterized protein n=1 Tax=Gnathostoma spinigerum TaxID=75299 RepID=A0ABD6EQS8_9BILA